MSKPYGVVYQLTSEDFLKIEQREIGYILRRLEDVLLLDNGETIACSAFVSSTWNLLPRPMPPTNRYKNLLITGCIENRIDILGGSHYVKWLQNVPTIEPKLLSQDHRYSDTKSEKAAKAFVVFLIICISSGFIITNSP